jgi:hypothetical protein
MKNKSLFFLIAISILLVCIFISGCTSESSGTDTNTDSAQETGGSGDMGDRPAGDGNMTIPDGNMTMPDRGNMTVPDGNMTPPDGGMGGGEMPGGEMPDGTPPEESS